MNATILSILINLLSSMIYDGITVAAQRIAPLNTENRLKKKIELVVSEKVKQELDKITELSKVFDSDAFFYYIKNMQPLTLICQQVFNPQCNIDVYSNELITKLLDDTSSYLKNHGQHISETDKSIIKDFYIKIMSICDSVLFALMNQDVISLARIMNLQAEAYGNRVATEIQETGSTIEQRIDLQGNLIKEQLQRLTATVSNSMKNDFSVSFHNKISIDTMPFKFQEGSEKVDLVKEVTSNLNSSIWIHIYGKIFTGKTQALIRIVERLASYIWIDIKEMDFQKINLNDIILNEDSVVIIDGIPNIAKQTIQEKCLHLLTECKKRKCRLITSGYEDIIPYLKGYLAKGEIFSIELLGLTNNEVDEIMCKHHAPVELMNTKSYQNFVELCKTLPPVIMEVIYRMEEKGWCIDDEVFTTVLSRRTKTLTEQMINLFMESISEDEARHLYYRIAYIGQPVKKTWIRSIADISKSILSVDLYIERLKNRWIYSDGNYYHCSNKIMEDYAEEQLEREERKQLDKFLVNELIKQSLGPIDVTNLMKCYTRLEDFDSVGMLCVHLMEEMRQQNVKDYIVPVEKFWQEMPLPEKMSPFVKCLVRFEQMHYKAWKGEKEDKINIKIEELWNIAEDDETSLLLIIFQGMRICVVNAGIGLEVFYGFITRYHGMIGNLESLHQMCDCLEISSSLMQKSIFTVYTEALGVFIENLENLERYISYMEQYFTSEQWIEMNEIENISAIIYCMLERVRKNSCDHTEVYRTALVRFYQMLDFEKVPNIWGSVLHSCLYEYHMEEKYEKAQELYYSVEDIIINAPIQFCEIIDIMARIARDNKDYSFEKQLFDREMDQILNMGEADIKSIMVDSSLLYLEHLTLEEQEQVEKIHKVLQYIATYIAPQEDFPYIKEKLEAEYWMKIYQLGEIEQRMGEFICFIGNMLNESDKRYSVTLQSILVKILHVLGYMGRELIHGITPDKISDGCEYAKPKLHMFWNNVDENEIIKYWQPEKREMLYYICSALAEKYGNIEDATWLFGRIIEKEKFWSTTLSYFYHDDSFMQFKLLEQQDIQKITYMIQKNYKIRECADIEIQGECFWIVREQITLSIYILGLYLKDKEKAFDFCIQLRKSLNEEGCTDTAKIYYQEYKKVLGVIIDEDADFYLLREIFYLLQKRDNLKNMDSAVLPLLLIAAPENQKEVLKDGIKKIIKTFNFEHDFMMERKLKEMNL